MNTFQKTCMRGTFQVPPRKPADAEKLMRDMFGRMLGSPHLFINDMIEHIRDNKFG